MGPSPLVRCRCRCAIAVLTKEEIRITRQVAKPIDLAIENCPLAEAIKQLASLGDFNIVLDNAGLEDEGLTLKEPVSIRVASVRLKSALTLLLEPLNLDYVLKNEVLLVTSRSRAAGRATVATYAVADLLHPDVSVVAELNGLCELDQQMIDPNSWGPVGGAGQIKANESTASLVVRQTQANHASIRELLETMRTLKAPRKDSAAQTNFKASSPNAPRVPIAGAKTVPPIPLHNPEWETPTSIRP